MYEFGEDARICSITDPHLAPHLNSAREAAVPFAHCFLVVISAGPHLQLSGPCSRSMPFATGKGDRAEEACDFIYYLFMLFRAIPTAYGGS